MQSVQFLYNGRKGVTEHIDSPEVRESIFEG